MGPDWRRRGRSWGDVGGLLGRLSSRNAEKKRKPKSFNDLRTINDLGLFGPSCRPLGPSWKHLGGLLGRLGLLDSLGPSWRPSWTISGEVGGHLGPYVRPFWANVVILASS
eukprot:7395324-Pyramimonas_sp.AAC.1